MPVLDNPRHEMFSHFVARGNIPETAYVAAGYRRDADAAAALMRVRRIKSRIEELRPFYEAHQEASDA